MNDEHLQIRIALGQCALDGHIESVESARMRDDYRNYRLLDCRSYHHLWSFSDFCFLFAHPALVAAALSCPNVESLPCAASIDFSSKRLSSFFVEIRSRLVNGLKHRRLLIRGGIARGFFYPKSSLNQDVP